MRILFTITGPWGTGAATVVDGVAEELRRRGHKVKIIFPDLGVGSEDKEKYYNRPDLYHIIKFPLRFRDETFYTYPLMITDPNPRNYSNAWTYKDLTNKQFRLLNEFFKQRFKRVINEFQPDVIETEHIWLMGYALAELGYNYIVGAHHSDQIGFHYDRRMRTYAMRCAKDAQYIFAVSDFIKKEVVSIYRVPPKKVIISPCGYNDKIFRPRKVSKESLLRKYGIKADSKLPVITFAGKISYTKGIDILLKANATLQKKFPCIVLIFGSGNINDVLKKSPKDDQLKNLHFIGHVTQKELAKFHNISKLSLLPSREEGFGIGALEAMGCGLPVIGTRSGQLEKFIVGKVVSPGNVSELASATKSILSLKSKAYKRLCSQALETAYTYSWKDIASERIKYYKEVRSNKSKRRSLA